MAKKVCDYCGEYYEEELMGTLDNGSPACPYCIAYEEMGADRKKQEKQNDKE